MSFAIDYASIDQPGSMTPRGVFIPPWYLPHKDLGLEVRNRHGEGLGFTIGDVAIERRWAIDPEGKVMTGHEFQDRLTEWYIGQWAWQHPPQPALPVDTSSYPTPENYVSKGPDPANPRKLLSLTQPVDRSKSATGERPVDPGHLAKQGWAPAPKKD